MNESPSAHSPLVTVYVTSYNYEEYIRQAIESVLSQTYKNYELIVIDDGSTDGSRKIIKEYASRKNVRIILQENKGLNATNNVAVRAARGNYIMRLDADDYLDQNALLVLVHAIEESPNAALVFPDYYYVDKEGIVTGQERRHDFSKEVTLLDQPAHGACTLIRKDCLLEVGAYSTKYDRQDGYDLWLKITDAYEVKNVNLPLFYYRKHGENLTTDTEKLLETRAKIYSEHVKRTERPEITTIAVLPLRGKTLNPHSQLLEYLGGKPLVCWTIDAVLSSSLIKELIVSSPDEDLLKYLKREYGDKITIDMRTIESAMENVSYHDSIVMAVENRRTEVAPDVILDLKAEWPFRSKFYIEKAINTMKIYDVDVVLGVVPENDLFYYHDGTGLKSIGNNDINTKLRLERDYIYRQSGGLMAAKYSVFMKERQALMQGKIGHAVLSRKASLSVLDSFEMSIARTLLQD